MSQQGFRQASVRALTGTQSTYEGDWHALFTMSGIPEGDYDGRLLAWITLTMGGSFTELNGAMQAFAESQGAANWSSMGSFSVWTPASLGASLLAWWDAEDTANISLSGSSVTTWTDKIGGYALTQALSASKPTYGPAIFNNRPGVNFDGADDQLTMLSVPFPINADPCEVWVLGSQDALAANASTRYVFGYGGNANLNQRRVQRVQGAGPVNRAQALAGNGATTVQKTDAMVDLSGRHVLRAPVIATSVNIIVDGNGNTVAAVVPATGSVQTRMGASPSEPASGFWLGPVAALYVTLPLTTDQAAQMTAYNKARGGIA